MAFEYQTIGLADYFWPFKYLTSWVFRSALYLDGIWITNNFLSRMWMMPRIRRGVGKALVMWLVRLFKYWTLLSLILIPFVFCQMFRYHSCTIIWMTRHLKSSNIQIWNYWISGFEWQKSKIVHKISSPNQLKSRLNIPDFKWSGCPDFRS